MSPVSSSNSAPAAIVGLSRAVERVNRSAERILELTRPEQESTPAATVDVSSESRAKAEAATADLASAMVDQQTAKAAFKASVKVLKTDDEVAKATLDIVK